MQSETLAEEFARLVREYRQDDGPGGIEAWNLIADFAVDNAEAIEAALYAEPVKTAPAVAVTDGLREAIEKLLDQAEHVCLGAHTPLDIKGAAKNLAEPIKNLHAALSAQVQDVSGWQPIETAPKDGTKFLAICKTGRPGQFIGQCYYVGPDKRYPTAKLDWFMNLDGWPQPTHWMPLPASPASKHGDAE